MFGFVQGYLGSNKKRGSSNASISVSAQPRDSRQSSKYLSEQSVAESRPPPLIPPNTDTPAALPPEPPKEHITILVLGRSGSGKTTLINNAFLKPKVEGTIESVPNVKPTSDVTSVRITTSKHKFKLIDTPGFDNPAMSDLEVFTKLASYLLNPAKTHTNVRGVLFLHPAGDHLESRSLVRTLHVITEYALGEAALSRLSVLVLPSRLGSLDSAAVARTLPRSTAFRFACDNGAKVLVSSLNAPDIDNIIMSYISQEPILLRVQQPGTRRSLADLRNQIEDYLGYYERNSMLRLVDEQVQDRLAPYEDEIRTLKGSLKDSQDKVLRLTKLRRQPESAGVDATALSQQLEQIQNENGSLRAQLQLEENIKQEDLVRSLEDLNRQIEALSRAVSAYLVDTYVQKLLNRDPGDVSALHARQLPELAALFKHVEGNSSLISSAAGAGMPVEDFFDYAIRSLLCNHICRRIFDPFHPGVDLSQSNVISGVYINIRRRETQPIAGKWRADCFKSMYKPTSQDTTAEHIKSIVQKIRRDSIDTVISHFFGSKVEVKIEAQHVEQLEALVRAAWDWNVTLKGDVVVQGDLCPVTFRPATRYDPKMMVELEQSSRKLLPEAILATLSLGLLSFRAVGGGRSPEMTVVAEALVATKSVYA